MRSRPQIRSITLVKDLYQFDQDKEIWKEKQQKTLEEISNRIFNFKEDVTLKVNFNIGIYTSYVFHHYNLSHYG